MFPMTVIEIRTFWAKANALGRDLFYPAFAAGTGWDKATVQSHFRDWNTLTHERAEAIAAKHGVTIREAGFQAYLAEVSQNPNAYLPEQPDRTG